MIEKTYKKKKYVWEYGEREGLDIYNCYLVAEELYHVTIRNDGENPIDITEKLIERINMRIGPFTIKMVEEEK